MTALSRSLWLFVAILLGAGCGSSSSSSSDSSSIRLNEILPSNGKGCPDEVGERNDWIELYNLGDKAVDLAGYSLTDDTSSPRKAVIPEGITIEGRSALLFWADNTPDQGKTHLPFKLGSKAEEVVLYDPDGKELDLVRWGISSDPVLFAAYSDVSFARLPDGTGKWVRCATPSCGESNNGSACGN
jgi:hypothetical protein